MRSAALWRRICGGSAGLSRRGWGRQGDSGGGAIAAGVERGRDAGGDHVADATGGGACSAEVEMFYWLYEECGSA